MFTATGNRVLSASAALTALALGALSLSGCGGGTSAQSESAKAKSVRAATANHAVYEFPVGETRGANDQSAIIRVGSTPITRAAFVHWDATLTPRIASYEPKSRGDCGLIMAPREVKLPKHGGAKLSKAQVKALCVRQHQELVRETALQQLVSYQWVLGEAAELSLAPSEAEAQKQLAKSAAKAFKSKAEFLHYLKESGRTNADALFTIRVEMATQRIQDLIQNKPLAPIDHATVARYYRTQIKGTEKPEAKKPLKQVEATVRAKLSEELFNREKARFIRAFREKWLARTSCSPGYVISRCREWRGPSVLSSIDPYIVR